MIRQINKFGISQHIALDFYEKEPALLRQMLIKDLTYRMGQEGYELYDEPLGMIMGYVKIGERGFYPVEKEYADMVEIYFQAKGIEKEFGCRREVRPIADKGYWESYWVHIKDCKGDHEYITG